MQGSRQCRAFPLLFVLLCFGWSHGKFAAVSFALPSSSCRMELSFLPPPRSEACGHIQACYPAGVVVPLSPAENLVNFTWDGGGGSSSLALAGSYCTKSANFWAEPAPPESGLEEGLTLSASFPFQGAGSTAVASGRLVKEGGAGYCLLPLSSACPRPKPSPPPGDVCGARFFACSVWTGAVPGAGGLCVWCCGPGPGVRRHCRRGRKTAFSAWASFASCTVFTTHEGKRDPTHHFPVTQTAVLPHLVFPLLFFSEASSDTPETRRFIPTSCSVRL